MKRKKKGKKSREGGKKKKGVLLSGESDVPPVEAGLELSAGVQGAAVQRHDAFTLQLRERLSPVFKLTRYWTQCVVHPRRHLHSDKQADETAKVVRFFFLLRSVL